METWELLLDS